MMGEKIPLPKVLTQKDTRAHPFPYQIALLTEEFIYGAIFWFVFADKAAGEFIRLPNGLSMLKTSLLKEGMKESDWKSGWECLEKHKNLFEKYVFQNVLITVRSYWDWYVKKLVDFIIFARDGIGDIFTNKELKKLRRITFQEILEQISLIEKFCKLDFQISEETKQNIKEMSLVRNLGLHNRWEVDQDYLNKTANKNQRQIGDIRLFNIMELRLWHNSLIDVIHKTCKTLAIKYVLVPQYPTKVN